MLLVIIAVLTVFVGIVGLIYCIRNCATASIAELNFRLRCAKGVKRELEKSEENQTIRKLKREIDEEITNLEEKIQKHWGRKIVRKGSAGVSTFDMM